MQYDAIVAREGKAFTIEFPDCLGCQTFAESEAEIVPMAREALEGWLETNLAERRVPPRPAHRASASRGSELVRVIVRARLSAALQVRWARQERDLSQADLAEMVGVSQQAIAKIEDPDGNPTLDTLEKVARALGGELRLDLIPASDAPRMPKRAGGMPKKKSTSKTAFALKMSDLVEEVKRPVLKHRNDVRPEASVAAASGARRHRRSIMVKD